MAAKMDTTMSAGHGAMETCHRKIAVAINAVQESMEASHEKMEYTIKTEQ
jgi:hypothetical protein